MKKKVRYKKGNHVYSCWEKTIIYDQSYSANGLLFGNVEQDKKASGIRISDYRIISSAYEPTPIL